MIGETRLGKHVMTSDQLSTESFKYHQCCPWLVLFRTFGLAVSLQLLIVSVAGVLVTTAGWRICGQILYGENAISQDASEDVFFETRRVMERWPGEKRHSFNQDLTQPENSLSETLSYRFMVLYDRGHPIIGVWQEMTGPFLEIIKGKLRLKQLIYFGMTGLWGLLAWSFFGAVITRAAALQFTVHQRATSGQLFRHARSKLGAYMAAPLLPLLVIFVIKICSDLFLGLAVRWEYTVWWTGLLWPFGLIAGFILMLMFVGLSVGWPLMWATISTEGTDSFDAISRSYGYCYQRPLHYLAYALLAVVIGLLGWLFVSFFTEGVIWANRWAMSWGAGGQDWPLVSGDRGNVFRAAVWLAQFWDAMVRTLAVGFRWSFFWVSAAGIYLLLRRDVDQTEMDEVYLEEEEDLYGLPDLTTDEAGVAGVEN